MDNLSDIDQNLLLFLSVVFGMILSLLGFGFCILLDKIVNAFRFLISLGKFYNFKR